MKVSETKHRDQYVLGRKAALISGFLTLAFFCMMQSSVISRNLRAYRPATIHKDMPLAKFQLDHNESWALSIAGHRPRGDGDSVVFNPSALEKRKSYEIKDNLKWHEGKPAVEKHPDALEWYRYSYEALGTKKKGTKTARKRLLIAQYSNQGEFAKIFEMTKPVNMAYAEHWGHDIVFLNAQDLPVREANLPTLLQLGWEQRDKYDQLLLLDGDAMMNNFRYDITRLFPDNEMMVAKRVVGRDDEHTWLVFGTVSLWNLKHLLVPRVQKTWSSRYEEGDPLISLSEQIKPYAETEVFTVTRQIENWDLAYIRTMQFATKNHGLRKIDPIVRIDRWKKEVQRACKKFSVDCSEKAQERRKAAYLELQANECTKRREPTWEWRKQRGVEPKTKKRLLVAQYVSYGKYAKLLGLTAPINKLYAKMWNADFVSVQGSTLVVDQDGGCEPPPQRAMYDKLDLLRLALHKKDKYDQLLLLDADAMIYDLDFDITTLANDDAVLIAQRVSEIVTRTHTDNINNGVVLWNLHHPKAEEIADDWYTSSRAAVELGNAHGDQHYLQAILRKNNRKRYVRSLAEEFRYRKGTVIKHFTRTHATNEWNNTRLDDREAEIALVVQEICEKYPDNCKEMEQTSYQR